MDTADAVGALYTFHLSDGRPVTVLPASHGVGALATDRRVLVCDLGSREANRAEAELAAGLRKR